jgi:hypothetical protein
MKDEPIEWKKHSQDVYQKVNYCTTNVYVVFVKGWINIHKVRYYKMGDWMP